MHLNKPPYSHDVSREKISELKQTYLDKQLQIESLEREREATLRLLSVAQSQNYDHSPRLSTEKSVLLEEAKRRAKERALLSDKVSIQKYLDGTEEKEPAFSGFKYDEPKIKIDNKKNTSNNNEGDAVEFKHFIDKEYLQLKQELENLRKGSKMAQSTNAIEKSNSYLNLNSKEPKIEIKYKEKPIRDIKTDFNKVNSNNILEKKTEISPKHTVFKEIKPKVFKTESTSIEILPETSRKSPAPRFDIESTKLSIKKLNIPEKPSNFINPSISIQTNEATDKTIQVTEGLNHPEQSQPVNSKRGVWKRDVYNPSREVYNHPPHHTSPYYNIEGYPHHQSPFYGYNQYAQYVPQPYPVYQYPVYPYNYPYLDKTYQYPIIDNLTVPNPNYQYPIIDKPTVPSPTYQYPIIDKPTVPSPNYQAPNTLYRPDTPDNLAASVNCIKDLDSTPKVKTIELQEIEIIQDDFKINPLDTLTYEESSSKNADLDINTQDGLENHQDFQVKIEKPVLIEIGTKPTKTLAEIFNEKKKKVAERIHSREDMISKQDHRGKTKEELIEIRKNFVKVPKSDLKKSEIIEIDVEEKKASKEPSFGLMERLSSGHRVKVSKEEMLKLNKKNYQLLPEVKKKQEEEKKKQEKNLRIQKAKNYERVKNI